MTLKPLTAEQRAEALKKATAARTVRAEAKEQLRTGKTTVSKVIARGETEEAISRLKVTDLIEAVPGIGSVKAQRIMEEIGIAATRRIRGLGAHQKKALIDRLEQK